MCLVSMQSVTDEMCIMCPVYEEIRDLKNLAKDSEFLKEHNATLRAQLDAATDKAVKYDCLIDTLFNALCESIAKKLL